MKTHEKQSHTSQSVPPLFIKVIEEDRYLTINQDDIDSPDYWISIFEKRLSLGFGVSEKFLLELYNKLKERFEDKNVTFDI